jgi:hypothetical protein
MAELEKVADELSKHATNVKSFEEADAFGRSAFNRYYYATYLTVRDMLAQINAKWAKIPHKNIPKTLEGDLVKLFRENGKKQVQGKAIHASQLHSYLQQTNAAAGDIASTLTSAYMVRVTADYEPDHKIEFIDNKLSLASHTLDEAKNWKRRVEAKKGILIKVAKELGIVS